MIPINISNKKDFDQVGNDIVNYLLKYIREAAQTGHYTIRKLINGHYQNVQQFVTPDTQIIFKNLNNKNKLKELIFVSPKKLPYRVNIFKQKAYSKQVINDIKELFVDVIYSTKLDKQKLIDAIGLNTCPYCNRNYIYTITKGKVNHQLDHFYPKHKYPLFAVSLYNLIPSCAMCNSAGAKGIKDPLEHALISPYLVKHLDFHFNYKLLSPAIIKGDYNGETIGIYLDNRKAENDSVFHLTSFYEKHDDHVVDLIYKRKFVYTDKFLKSLSKIIGNKINQSIINRFLTGAYTTEDEYHKRPLSKLYTEIAKAIGLIK